MSQVCGGHRTICRIRLSPSSRYVVPGNQTQVVSPEAASLLGGGYFAGPLSSFYTEIFIAKFFSTVSIHIQKDHIFLMNSFLSLT